MKLSLLFICCTAGIFISVNAKRTTRIRDGVEIADITSVPWNSYITIANGQIICSASVIGKRNVLTAAHCSCGKPVGNLRIVTGAATNKSPRRRTYTVKAKYEHPDYLAGKDCSRTGKDDIALLETANNIRFDAFTKPIQLDFNPVPIGSQVVMQGYGLNKIPKKYGKLRTASSKIVSCPDKVEELLCTHRKLSSLMSGDSGGPLLKCHQANRCKQIGINGGYWPDHSLYINIRYYSNFIRKHKSRY